MVKLVFILIIMISSFLLLVVNMADGANVFPAWLMAYSSYFLYIWFTAIAVSLLGLLL
jgi:hypothetical protein